MNRKNAELISVSKITLSQQARVKKKGLRMEGSRVGEVAQVLRGLAVLSEDPSPILSTHMTLLALTGTTHITSTHSQSKHLYK